MEKRTPFFLTSLLKRSEKSESNKEKGWKNTTDNTTFNGWGSGSLSKLPEVEKSSNGWTYNKPKDDYNGWGSGSPETSCVGESATYEQEPVSTQENSDMGTTWAPLLVPSAPPLSEEGYEYSIAHNSDVVLMNASQNGDALCVVCWEARVEGAFVPCGHMATCMACLHEIESKQGSCPICRAKIDKVMRIYAISTKYAL